MVHITIKFESDEFIDTIDDLTLDDLEEWTFLSCFLFATDEIANVVCHDESVASRCNFSGLHNSRAGHILYVQSHLHHTKVWFNTFVQ